MCVSPYSNRRRQELILLTVLILCFFDTAAAGPIHPAPSGNERCGDSNTYVRFDKCECDEEYGVLVKHTSIPVYDLPNYNQLVTGSGKLKYYYCRRCGICEDGRATLAKCHEGRDTVCGECLHPLIYDEGTKSCQPAKQSTGNVLENVDDVPTIEPVVVIINRGAAPTVDVHTSRMSTISSDERIISSTEDDELSDVPGNGVKSDPTKALPIVFIAVSTVVIVVIVCVIVFLIRRRESDVSADVKTMEGGESVPPVDL